MSRVLGSCFVFCDAVTTVAMFVTSSGAWMVVAFSAVMSVALMCASSAVRSVLCPTYFWDQPEPVRLAVAKKSR